MLVDPPASPPRTRALRVLHVASALALRYGGPSRVVPEMSRALAARGHHVMVVSTNVDGPNVLDVPLERSVDDEGVEVRYYPVIAPRRFKASPAMRRDLKVLIPAFDIVHIHGIYLFPSLTAARMCQRYNTPYVLRPHGTLNAKIREKSRLRKAVYNTLWEKRNVKMAAALQFSSNLERDFAMDFVPTKATFVEPNGVDVESLGTEVAPETLLAREPAIGQRKIVSFLGRIARVKRLDRLIDAFAAATTGDTDPCLVIAGPDDEGLLDGLLRRAASRGVADSVFHIGVLDGSDKIALLQHSSAVVLCSDSESFGVSAAEALAAGTPVIVSRDTGIAQYVSGTEAGVVVDGSSDGIAFALRLYLDDSKLRHRAGAAARDLALSQFDWSRIAQRLEMRYFSLLDDPSGMPRNSPRGA